MPAIENWPKPWGAGLHMHTIGSAATFKAMRFLQSFRDDEL